MNHVKEFRKNMGLSQLELAKSIGVSRQTINMIENNKYNPTLELCLNLAKVLNTDRKVAVDYSFKEMLSEEKQKFLQSSGLALG